MKKAETQEQEFLEVCSSYDHDLLTGKKEMTLTFVQSSSIILIRIKITKQKRYYAMRMNAN